MDYDIYEAFEAIENELIESQMRNFRRHRAEEDKEGYKWSQWQGEQLKSLERYRNNNSKKFRSKFSSINSKVADMLKKAREDGNAEQEVAILEAIQNGFKVPDIVPDSMTGEFFKLNDRKLDALIKATVSDLEQAETAILRRADDQYRKAIFNAQVYANTGAGTYEKAVDMACRDMLRAGLACVEYKNGAIHQLSDYAEMAIRTANKRAYLYGEGEKRKEFGITTVVVNSRQGGCSLCAKYIGKIFIDDVYSGGKKSDGNYPLLSDAIKGGLFHPRCKDSTSTYYEGITTLQKVTPEEMAEMDRREKLAEQQSYCKNQAKKNQRIATHSLDKDNQRVFQKRADAYSKKADEIGGLIKNDFEVRPGAHQDAKANLDLVNSYEYLNKFSELDVSDEVKIKICQLSQNIIRRRDGTKIEEVFAIDKTSGRVLSHIKGNTDYGANMSDKFKNVLKTHKKGSIIILHNHPLDFTFSTNDVKTASKYKSIGGVIASTHAGNVHYFTGVITNFEQLERDYRIAYTKCFTRLKKTDGESRILAWDTAFRKVGVKFIYE